MNDGAIRRARVGRWLTAACAFAAVAGVLAGCGLPPGPALRYTVRPMNKDGMTGYRMEGNYVSTPPIPHTRLAINAVRAEAANGRVFYLIEANLAAGDFIDIPPGESLVFTADGERIALSGPGSQSSRTVVTQPPIWFNEVGLYHISADDLRRLAAARQLQLRLAGRKSVIENAFSPLNQERLRAFVAANVR